MQDEVREKSVALTIKVGKAGGRLTAGLLKWAIRKYLAQTQNPKIHHGKRKDRGRPHAGGNGTACGIPPEESRPAEGKA